MAKATTGTETRERVVKDRVSVYNVTLEKDEARLLYSILRNVGGSPDKGRKHADSVLRALDAAGVGYLSRFATRGSIQVEADRASFFDSVIDPLTLTTSSNPFRL